MSGVVTVNSGAFGTFTGGGTIEVVNIPVSFSSDIISYIDSFFGANFTLGATGVFYEVAALDPSTLTNGGTLAGLEQFTSGISGGTGSVTASAVVNSLALAVEVQAPGDVTLTGATATELALFSAQSNVDYTVTDGVASSIFLGGGADSVTLYATSTTLNDSIYSSGADTINQAAGNGSVQVTAEQGADDEVIINSASETVTATGNATVGVNWENQNSGGTIDFINQSSAAATVFSGIFSNGSGGFVANAANVTAFGGAGGGFFIGGQKGGPAGANFLVGGAPGSVTIGGTGVITQVSADSTAGIVTLVGGADGSILDAQGAGTGSVQSSANTNAFFAGSGQETLIAAATTDNNLFQIGLKYPGLGSPQSNGVVSTEGSGYQTFFLGNSAGATIYGSTAAAENIYNFVSDATAGGGVFTVENFASNSILQFVDGSGTAAGSATVNAPITDPFNSNDVLIGLTDGTQITLKNTSLSDVHVTTINGVTSIF